MTIDRAQQFLEAEANADRLIVALETLRKESEGFSTAAGHLDKAGDELALLGLSMTEIAEGLQLSVRLLVANGVPAVLDSQVKMSADVEALQASSDALRDHVATSLDEQREGFATELRKIALLLDAAAATAGRDTASLTAVLTGNVATLQAGSDVMGRHFATSMDEQRESFATELRKVTLLLDTAAAKAGRDTASLNAALAGNVAALQAGSDALRDHFATSMDEQRERFAVEFLKVTSLLDAATEGRTLLSRDLTKVSKLAAVAAGLAGVSVLLGSLTLLI